MKPYFVPIQVGTRSSTVLFDPGSLVDTDLMVYNVDTDHKDLQTQSMSLKMTYLV